MATEESTSQEAAQESPSRERVYEVKGAGFLPGVPGEFANCKVIVFNEHVIRIEPLGDFARSIVLLSSQQPEESADEQQQDEVPGALHQAGGVIPAGGRALIGEPGPETISLPEGTTVLPTAPGAGNSSNPIMGG